MQHTTANRLASFAVLAVFVTVVCIESIYMYPKFVKTYDAPTIDQRFVVKVNACRILPMNCDSDRPYLINCYNAVVESSACSFVIGTYSTSADAQIYCNGLAPVGTDFTAFRNADDPSICAARPRTAYQVTTDAAINMFLIVFSEVFVCFVALLLILIVIRRSYPQPVPAAAAGSTNGTAPDALTAISTTAASIQPAVEFERPPQPDHQLVDVEPALRPTDSTDRNKQ